MKPNLKSLRKGDIIKGHRTMKVLDKIGARTILADVQSEQKFSIETDGSTAGSWHFEMVKKAAPQVGDVVTGAEVRDLPFMRGTVLIGVVNGHTLVLTSDGDWFSPAKYENRAFEVDEYISALHANYLYRILHLPRSW